MQHNGRRDSKAEMENTLRREPFRSLANLD